MMTGREYSFKWLCPFCDRYATIRDGDYRQNWLKLQLDEPDDEQFAIKTYSIQCPNPECGHVTVRAERWLEWPASLLHTWNLIPPSEAKAFPDYVPQAIREDYEEACLIRDLSSKASATLSRRCLQGMIRDFWKVNTRNLKQAIDAIEDNVDPLTWEAIQAVRKIGNIGAHMEKDINIIIEVEPDEAQLLVELIEQLIDDWYIARREREERLKKLKNLGADKDAVRGKAQGDK